MAHSSLSIFFIESEAGELPFQRWASVVGNRCNLFFFQRCLWHWLAGPRGEGALIWVFSLPPVIAFVRFHCFSLFFCEILNPYCFLVPDGDGKSPNDA